MTDDADADDEAPASGDGADAEPTTGTFLVTEVDVETAVLQDVGDAQIHTLGENPDLETGEVLEGTLAPEPPMAVTWEVVEIERRREIPVEHVDLEPTARSMDLGADQPVGEFTREEREGEGEIHVLTVDPDATKAAADEVAEDQETVTRAARLGVDRVEVRAADGVVSVRYLPD